MAATDADVCHGVRIAVEEIANRLQELRTYRAALKRGMD